MVSLFIVLLIGQAAIHEIYHRVVWKSLVYLYFSGDEKTVKMLSNLLIRVVGEISGTKK